jgi:hypothetical protein
MFSPPLSSIKQKARREGVGGGQATCAYDLDVGYTDVGYTQALEHTHQKNTFHTEHIPYRTYSTCLYDLDVGYTQALLQQHLVLAL